jgi:hypothetical protein
MIRNSAMTDAAAGLGHFHRSVITTYSSNTVMTIVSVTAIPYAAARSLEDPKPMTMNTQATMSAQFTCGT